MTSSGPSPIVQHRLDRSIMWFVRVDELGEEWSKKKRKRS